MRSESLPARGATIRGCRRPRQHAQSSVERRVASAELEVLRHEEHGREERVDHQESGDVRGPKTAFAEHARRQHLRCGAALVGEEDARSATPATSEATTSALRQASAERTSPHAIAVAASATSTPPGTSIRGRGPKLSGRRRVAAIEASRPTG